MRLASVRIQNFRSFADETIYFNDYTCLVGPNGGGKSTVLIALNVFFRHTADAATDLLKLDREDFHHGDVSKPAIITVTFDQLNDTAQHDFKDYVRQGQLIVSAKAQWNADDGYAEVFQYGERLGITDFRKFFESLDEGGRVADLKQIYFGIQEKYPDLPPARTKQSMIDALRQFEEEHPDQCVPIPSEDQFYGFSKGVNLLQKYIQWAYVPAVKDASEEQVESKKSVLGVLVERTVRAQVSFDEQLKELRDEFRGKYQAMLDERQDALAGISDSLSQRLNVWAHPNARLQLQWQNDSSSSVKVAEPLAEVVAGEGAFQGRLDRFGHGLQRSFILTLLEELAGYDQSEGPQLLLACEEPELFQHPPQTRHLVDVLQKLTKKNSQVIVCTHSPYFISGRRVDDVRLIKPSTDGQQATSSAVTIDEVSNDIQKYGGSNQVSQSTTAFKLQNVLQPELNEIFLRKFSCLWRESKTSHIFPATLSFAANTRSFVGSGATLFRSEQKARC